MFAGEYKKDELLEAARSGNEEKLASLLTPLNVNCHASDGRKVGATPESLTVTTACRFMYFFVLSVDSAALGGRLQPRARSGTRPAIRGRRARERQRWARATTQRLFVRPLRSHRTPAEGEKHRMILALLISSRFKVSRCFTFLGGCKCDRDRLVALHALARGCLEEPS